MAKRANSYSAAMVMICKTGESSSNGAPPKWTTISDATEFKTFALYERANVITNFFEAVYHYQT